MAFRPPQGHNPLPSGRPAWLHIGGSHQSAMGHRRPRPGLPITWFANHLADRSLGLPVGSDRSRSAFPTRPSGSGWLPRAFIGSIPFSPGWFSLIWGGGSRWADRSAGPGCRMAFRTAGSPRARSVRRAWQRWSRVGCFPSAFRVCVPLFASPLPGRFSPVQQPFEAFPGGGFRPLDLPSP